MKTSNPKVGMLTEMEYAKSKVISRKSTGLKVNRKDWNQGSISVKPNASGASEINDYIKNSLFLFWLLMFVVFFVVVMHRFYYSFTTFNVCCTPFVSVIFRNNN